MQLQSEQGKITYVDNHLVKRKTPKQKFMPVHHNQM